jgi:hypothetical protein
MYSVLQRKLLFKKIINIYLVMKKKYELPDKKILIGCYHPSPRNVNTGRIDEKKMTSLFKKAIKLT